MPWFIYITERQYSGLFQRKRKRRPRGSPLFDDLSPDVRAEAERLFDRLCERWAGREGFDGIRHLVRDGVGLDFRAVQILQLFLRHSGLHNLKCRHIVEIVFLQQAQHWYKAEISFFTCINSICFD
jgi:hypothetical protein